MIIQIKLTPIYLRIGKQKEEKRITAHRDCSVAANLYIHNNAWNAETQKGIDELTLWVFLKV